jgi:hypothetical protein
MPDLIRHPSLHQHVAHGSLGAGTSLGATQRTLDSCSNVPYTFRAQDSCQRKLRRQIIKFESGIFVFAANPALFLKSEETRSSARRRPENHQVRFWCFLISPSGQRGKRALQAGTKEPAMDDDTIIETPDGPMTWGAWKKKNPVQVPSRRTKGKDLPNKVKKFTDR